MIEHDARTIGASSGMFADWRPEDGARYEIHVITTSDGRRLEVMNVNASPVESRTGTDMIYYYEPAHSFTLSNTSACRPARNQRMRTRGFMTSSPA